MNRRNTVCGEPRRQQAGARRARITDTARAFIDHPERFEWLRTLLATHGLDARAGILAELRSVPDQDCWVHYGVWLTGSSSFIRFTADEAYGARALDSSGRLEHSSIEDVTAGTSMDEFVPGTGRSFGFLALEVLRQLGRSEAAQ